MAACLHRAAIHWSDLDGSTFLTDGNLIRIGRSQTPKYFDVSTDGECIILRPLQKSRADEVRTRLAELGIDEQDVKAAVSWARKSA